MGGGRRLLQTKLRPMEGQGDFSSLPVDPAAVARVGRSGAGLHLPGTGVPSAVRLHVRIFAPDPGNPAAGPSRGEDDSERLFPRGPHSGCTVEGGSRERTPGEKSPAVVADQSPTMLRSTVCGRRCFFGKCPRNPAGGEGKTSVKTGRRDG